MFCPGDGVYSADETEYSRYNPFSNTGIQPDEPGYNKEAENIADYSRSQMTDLTRKMKLQRQLAAAIHRDGSSTGDNSKSRTRLATDQAVQSAMNAAAMVQLALAESERAAVTKAQLATIGDSRQYEFNSLVTKLSDYRSQRLSQESFPLPPTHFFILGTLGALVALSFALLSPPTSFITAPSTAAPKSLLGGALAAFTGVGKAAHQTPVFSSTSRLLFSLLVSCIALVIDFSLDLNVPFGGIYQVRWI